MAAFYTSPVHVGVVPANIIAGYLINRLKSYRRVYVGGFIIYSFQVTGDNNRSFHVNPGAGGGVYTYGDLCGSPGGCWLARTGITMANGAIM
ncbi:hypothetical protein [Moorella stamsii]|uniref:hypothetical protein n=1 Tax=Neomoorella stamsii TaxID=1266720 RepID=UPI0006D576DE|nr:MULTISPECIES: hypothetical protein [Moorella]